MTHIHRDLTAFGSFFRLGFLLPEAVVALVHQLVPFVTARHQFSGAIPYGPLLVGDSLTKIMTSFFFCFLFLFFNWIWVWSNQYAGDILNDVKTNFRFEPTSSDRIPFFFFICSVSANVLIHFVWNLLEKVWEFKMDRTGECFHLCVINTAPSDVN